MADVVLTPAQRAVVENRGGALLVSAAAGSGKTKVLVDRLLSMVLSEEAPSNIDDFLMITYTKAAAAELRGKILAAMQERLAREPENRRLQRQMTRLYLAQISTVHAFCSELLREYAYRLDIPADFRVMEETEAQPLRERAMRQAITDAYAEMDPDFRAFADTLGSGRDDRKLGELAEKLYGAAQTHRDPQAWLERCTGQLAADEDDFGKTPWGAELLAELRRCGSDAAAEMEAAIRLLQNDEKLAEAYLPQFAETLEQLRVLEHCEGWDDACAAAAAVSFGWLKAVRKCGDPDAKETAQEVRKSCQERLTRLRQRFALPSAEALRETAALAPAIIGAVQLAGRFAALYTKEKRRRHLMDFNDLEHETLRLLYGTQGDRPTAAAREIAVRYREILVDEYQDSNEVQDAIFRAISREETNLFMVGDVKQSIYRFRLADPTLFLQKYRDFALYTDAEPGAPRKILLSENFRSREEVLDAANCVFRRAMSARTGEVDYGDAEALRAGLTFPPVPEPPVELHCIASDLQTEEEEAEPKKAEIEAAFAAERIAEVLRGAPCVNEKGTLRTARPSDVAILLRSPSSTAAIYQRALQRWNIPCFSDAGEDILQTTELQVLSSLLEVVENPHQDIPLLAVLASPLFGFTGEELAMLRGGCRKGDFYEALCCGETEKAQAFLRQLAHFRDTAQTDGLSALLDIILTETDAEAVFRAMPGGTARAGNVREFCALVRGHAQNGGDLTGFVRSLKNLREKGIPVQAAAEGDAVTLTSIHKSKGLEYPIVVLADLSKVFNQEDLRGALLTHPTLGIVSDVTDLKKKVRYPSTAKQAVAERMKREMVSEELRVLYVAMTRAKDKLIMTFCAKGLEKKLEKLRKLRACTPPAALAARASCLGDWVLAEALGRTEAGALQAAAGISADAAVQAFPWRIALHSGSEVLQHAVQPFARAERQNEQRAPEAEALERLLDYRYPYLAASRLPSKLTATQLKGRQLDEEIAELAQPAVRERRRVPPAFLEEKTLTPAEAGTALHLAMQFLRYESCGSLAEIEAELARLRAEEYLTQQQAQAVDPEKILRFFDSPLGKRVRSAPKIRREFKFSLLLDAAVFDKAAEGEQILLQGVTDCCLIEPDGVAVLDFKTDRIPHGGEAARAAHYRGQLDGYALALARIFGMPVKEKILYFFATDTAYTV